MKKLTTVLVIALMTTMTFFAIGGNTEESNNDAFLIAEAKVALGDCSNYGGVVYGVVDVMEQLCENGSVMTQVTLYSRPICPPGYMCAQYIRTIGTVTFDCNHAIVEVSCE